MTDLDKILRMIQNVDPADSAGLDEIDARVWCYLKDKTYKNHTGQGQDPYGRIVRGGVFIQEHTETDPWRLNVPYANCDQYTRSRDALKAIRPEGWWFQYNGCQGLNYPKNRQPKNTAAQIYDPIVGVRFESPRYLTEELAELFVILQALQHERQRDD